MTQTSYVVRDPGAALRHLAVSLAGAVVLAAIVGFGQGRWGLAVLLIVVTILFTAAGAWRAFTLLSVSEQGIATSFSEARSRNRRAISPWRAIHRVEVDPGAEVVRVVLRADVPLPWWVRARILDPSEPEAGGSWEKRVPGLDPVAFELAVRAHAPELEIRTVTKL